jgi:hypothetical protein
MNTFTILETHFGYSRSDVFDQTELLVKIAAKYGGLVFGGYVRDVIIPLKKLGRPLKNLDFKDMDFWFKNDTNAKAFVKEAGLTPGTHETHENPTGSYPVCRNQHFYNYKGASNAFIIIDVMVTDFYPVCDFSVNLVSWNGEGFTVHKPYDIISHVAREIISKDDELRRNTKFYTLEEISSGFKLYKPERSEYTLDEMMSYLNLLKNDTFSINLLTNVERQTYLDLIKESEPKSYLLEEIVEQIRNNYYDTSRNFEWMAQKGHEYPKFKRISEFVSHRIYHFKGKKLGGSALQPNHGHF